MDGIRLITVNFFVQNKWSQALRVVRHSLEPRLSVPDFVSQLWRKFGFSPKLRDKIRNREPVFETRSDITQYAINWTVVIVDWVLTANHSSFTTLRASKCASKHTVLKSA